MRRIKSVSLKNCTINVDDMTVTEYTKDEQYTHSLADILNEWNNVDGVSIVIRKENEENE